jgi:hypothetical protein
MNKKIKNMKKKYFVPSVIAILVLVSFVSFFHSAPKTKAQSASCTSAAPCAVTGTAVFVNTTPAVDPAIASPGYLLYFTGVGGTSSPYTPCSVTYNPTTGMFGNAWSPEYGWVVFNGWTAEVYSLQNPNDAETPTAWATGAISLNSSTGTLGGAASDPSGAAIPFGVPPSASANISPYGVTFNSSNQGSGDIWGGNVLGWIDFSGTSITPNTTSSTLDLEVNGTSSATVNVGSPVMLSWTGSSDEASCSPSDIGPDDGGWSNARNYSSVLHIYLPDPGNANAFYSTSPLNATGLETYTIICTGNTGVLKSSAQVTINGCDSTTYCCDSTAANYNSPLPCVYTCTDIQATNYGSPLPCVYPPGNCTNINATNYGDPLPCIFPVNSCLNLQATNYGGPLPCVYPPGNCTNTNATNYGDPLPCVYPAGSCTDPNAINAGQPLPCQYQRKPHYTEN